MYADDTALIFTGNSLSTMQVNLMAELVNVSDWFIQNKLTLHPGKSMASFDRGEAT